jgi:hypothetical protein
VLCRALGNVRPEQRKGGDCSISSKSSISDGISSISISIMWCAAQQVHACHHQPAAVWCSPVVAVKTQLLVLLSVAALAPVHVQVYVQVRVCAQGWGYSALPLR